jgi:hypothetical protein
MELNLAAGDGGERSRGQARDLAQEFFQSVFVFRGNAFRGSLGFAQEFLGETSAGGGRKAQSHLAMSGASGNHRVADIGSGGGKALGRNFEDGWLS